jgi:hypothetical protein
MFVVNEDLSIYATRGDAVYFTVTADDNGSDYVFKSGDVLRFKVFGKKDVESVYLQRDFPVVEQKTSVEVYLSSEDTKMGEPINKPTDFWYEIELNPDKDTKTIVGYDENGAKIFRLYPEGVEVGE